MVDGRWSMVDGRWSMVENGVVAIWICLANSTHLYRFRQFYDDLQYAQ
ncbi:MAG: hypothetical protein ABI551_09980 [Polyangiaceae bacterium]